MSGGFPLKCDFCEVECLESTVRSLCSLLIDEYGFLVPMPSSNFIGSASMMFHLEIGEDNRITKSLLVSSSGITLEEIVGNFVAERCVRVESQLVVRGRVIESQLTLREQADSGRLSVNVVFLRPEQLLTQFHDEDFLRSTQELFVDVAHGTGSAGFLLDYFLDEDPDIASLTGKEIADHLGRSNAPSTRHWRGRNRPGLIAGVSERLVSLEMLRKAWGPSANIFTSRGFVGVSLTGP
jgi:hypothetical protein